MYWSGCHENVEAHTLKEILASDEGCSLLKVHS